jgi:uncharacterized protein with PIN domain
MGARAPDARGDDVAIAHLRFYAELNDLLPPARRGATFALEFRGRPAVKDVIESMGVPHTEVDLLLGDGEPVDFSWRLHDGARVSVFPVFEALDVSSVTRVRAVPLREPRFVLDGHLGRLARALRMLGFDAAWRRDADDPELARTSAGERRVLLTRDRGLLKRRAVTHGHLVRADEVREQAAEVLHRLDLVRAVAPFRRCLRCNALLETVRKEDVLAGLPPRVREGQREFRRCPQCGRVYWPGTHHRRMLRAIDEIVALARGDPPPP